MSRLDDLKTELFKIYGRRTKWRAYCQRENAITEEEQIRVAEKVLSEECTGTIAECRYYDSELKGIKPEMLSENDESATDRD